MTPELTTVANLIALSAPTRAELDAKPDSRFPAELKTYTVQAYLVGFKRETDEDFHIVIADLDDPKKTMIVEMPAGDCMPTTDGGSLTQSSLRNEAVKLQASWQARFGKATPKFRNVAVHKMKVEVTGVGFFDFLHGQTGVAPNGFELHRVIAWKEIPEHAAALAGPEWECHQGNAYAEPTPVGIFLWKVRFTWLFGVRCERLNRRA